MLQDTALLSVCALVREPRSSDRFAPALGEAASLAQQGKLEEADQQAQLALSDPQDSRAACSVLGSIRFQQKRFPESASLLRKQSASSPIWWAHILNLAEVYIVQGKPDLALPLYRHVLTLDPSNTTARLELARSETEKGNYQQSLELARPVSRAQAVSRRPVRAGDRLLEDQRP